MIRKTGILFLLLCSATYGDFDQQSLTGEWAVAPSGSKTTAIFAFKEDGTVINKTADGYGTYHFLNDGRLMIEFPDGIILGQPKNVDGKILISGTFSASQPLSMSFSDVTPEKIEEAKETQAKAKTAVDEYLASLERVRSTSQKYEIINNLRQIASAAQQMMLDEGVAKVKLSDIVGEGKRIKSIESVNGEKYDDLEVCIYTTVISVKDADGKEIKYEF